MAGGTYRETLRHPGVWPFLWTQFLGAFNDNVCKIIVAFLVMRALVARPGRASMNEPCVSSARPMFPIVVPHLAEATAKLKKTVEALYPPPAGS